MHAKDIKSFDSFGYNFLSYSFETATSFESVSPNPRKQTLSSDLHLSHYKLRLYFYSGLLYMHIYHNILFSSIYIPHHKPEEAIHIHKTHQMELSISNCFLYRHQQHVPYLSLKDRHHPLFCSASFPFWVQRYFASKSQSPELPDCLRASRFFFLSVSSPLLHDSQN